MALLLRPWSVLMEQLSPGPAAVLTGEPDAEAFVAGGMRDLLRLLTDARRTPAQRAVAFASAIRALTDTARVADLVLGPHGSRFSSDQSRRFVQALSAYAGRFYDGRLWRGAETVTVLGSISPRPDEVVVAYTINAGQGFQPIKMSWRVVRAADGWRLIDVEHGGAWLTPLHRRSCAVLLREAGGDPEPLIRRLGDGRIDGLATR
jgi:ABC-type transporter MlaC component